MYSFAIHPDWIACILDNHHEFQLCVDDKNASGGHDQYVVRDVSMW